MAKLSVGQWVTLIDKSGFPGTPGETFIITDTDGEWVALARMSGESVASGCQWDSARFAPCNAPKPAPVAFDHDSAYYEAITDG